MDGAVVNRSAAVSGGAVEVNDLAVNDLRAPSLRVVADAGAVDDVARLARVEHLLEADFLPVTVGADERAGESSVEVFTVGVIEAAAPSQSGNEDRAVVAFAVLGAAEDAVLDREAAAGHRVEVAALAVRAVSDGCLPRGDPLVEIAALPDDFVADDVQAVGFEVFLGVLRQQVVTLIEIVGDALTPLDLRQEVLGAGVVLLDHDGFAARHVIEVRGLANVPVGAFAVA